jgi:uncharacterized protein YdcH (DUF465 family)|tara:strand:+ start:656 stop:922 length:267 start_codon:yes stop_codon:yes gene_type:complete
MGSFDLKRKNLLENRQDFRQLADQHQELDNRINKLSRQLYRSDRDVVEEATLKKRKLQLKDQMEMILRQHPSHASEQDQVNFESTARS